MKKILYSLDLGNDSLKMCYSYEHKGKAVVGNLQLLDDRDTVPAVALYDLDNDSWNYGAEALALAENSQRPIVRIKELMEGAGSADFYNGYDFENTDFAYKFRSVSLTVKQVLNGFFDYVLVDLLAKAIAKLDIDDSEQANQIIFTFPSKVSDDCKIVMKSIIQSLGFNPRAIAEPTAAAAYCMNDGVKLGKHVLVVDIGVKESSIAIFNPNSSTVDSLNMLKIDSINQGSKDFDNALFEHVVSQSGKVEEITNYQKFKLLEQIRAAKESLSSGEQEVMLEYQSDSVVYVNVSKEQFNDICNPIMVDIANSVLNLINENPDINQVILSGGSSKNPHLIDVVSELVNKKFPSVNLYNISKGIFGVAHGAGIIATGVSSFQSIATKGYGFACTKGSNKKAPFGLQIVINKNDKLPISVTKKVALKEKNQKSVEINVMSTDMETKANAFITPIGETENSLQCGVMEFDTKVRKGALIKVRVFIDEDGIGGVEVVGPKKKGTYKTSFEID